MFQAWNVGNLTQEYFGVDPVVTGVLLAVIVGAVILGGIKRIGSVAGKLVPFMCVLYVLMGLVVLTMKIDLIPEMIGLIFTSAFSPTEASGAFVGGTMGMAFMMGMKRALFSNEAGQGSAPIAHAAAKTNEPIREGVVAGLEPFIDTIVVCTLTALVIMVSGAWNRGPDGAYEADQVFMERADEGWQIRTPPLPDHATGAWESGNGEAFMLVDVPVEGEDGAKTMQRQRVSGSVEIQSGSEGDLYVVTWAPIESAEDAAPIIVDRGVYEELPGANLTSFAFDSVIPSSGKWIVTLAAWLFAISTMISWSYYGEQGIHFLLGTWAVFPYKMIFCALIIVSCMGFITTDAALDALTGLGTGVMLFANIPIMLIFGAITMKAYHAYMRKLRDGEFEKK
jgi:AGCS family alanine or glycine:cation symporter